MVLRTTSRIPKPLRCSSSQVDSSPPLLPTEPTNNPNGHGNYSPRNTPIHITRLATEHGTFPTLPSLMFENNAATIERVIQISPAVRLEFLVCIALSWLTNAFQRISYLNNGGRWDSLIVARRCHCIQLGLLHGRDTPSAVAYATTPFTDGGSSTSIALSI